MHWYLLPFILLLFGNARGQQTATPDQLYGKLFEDVQISSVFPDSKIFVDCVPKKDPHSILKAYRASKISAKDTAALRQFVEANFYIPAQIKSSFTTSDTSLRAHINTLWRVLTREKDVLIKGSSLLPLPFAYVVPGGRFREIYYWDSYFTMLGLKESGQTDLIEKMVNNFAFLIDQHGHIPNGNRTYYLSRSQPPFFSLMVSLLAGIKGEKVYNTYSNALEKELLYWKGNNNSNTTTVTLNPSGIQLYRYWDALSIPRQESYLEDVQTVTEAARSFFVNHSFASRDSFMQRTYKHLRAAAASGWDFSSRWFSSGGNLSSIKTLDIIPVDLNALLYHLESSVDALAKKEVRENIDPHYEKAGKIKQLKRIFFNDSLGWYCDYDLNKNKTTDVPTLAGMYPLFFQIADPAEVPRIVEFLKTNFLKEGGVVTSMNVTGEQWDAPNGWAPLQWITIVALENYGYHDLAKTIAERWFKLNKKVFLQTGKLMEKYNVMETDLEAGGGEYPSQDGFGWTNGVLLTLMNKYGWN
jgi:alpha,alpha-trehalase